MAPASKGDCAECDAGGGYARSDYRHGNWPVCCYSNRGIVWSAPRGSIAVNSMLIPACATG
jgi:hypothetical protein